MIFSFELNVEARNELTEAYLWYEEQQEGLGNSFRAEFQNKLNLICNNPLHYKISRRKFHEALIDRFPFLIIYTIEEKSQKIIVFAVFHTSRDPKKKFRK